MAEAKSQKDEGTIIGEKQIIPEKDDTGSEQAAAQITKDDVARREALPSTIIDVEALALRVKEALGIDIEPVRTRISRKLHQWIIFSVAAALLPIFVNAYRAVVNGGSFFNYDIISHGELVLVCAAVSAEAIGDLVMSGKTKGSWNMYSLGTCLMVFFLSSAVFVIAESQPRRPDLIALTSVVMFVLTLLAGASCKALAEI